MNYPLVSIGIISFNNDLYLRECIESCLAQTYTNLEIIVADDASTDGSPEIIKEYVQRYPNKIRAVLACTNAGLTFNFNKAIKASKGEWLKIISSDDLLRADCIEIYIAAVNQYSIQSGILFGRVIKFGPYINTEEVSDVPPFFVLNESQRLRSLIMDNSLIAPGSFFKVSTLYEIGLADERYPFLEDYPMWVKAQLSGVSMFHIDAITVKYRIHESLSSSKNRIGHLGYYQSCLKFSQEVLWPLRYGWNRLKNIEDYIQLQRFIYSIIWFNNRRNFGYYFIEFCTKPLKIYSNFNNFKNIIKNPTKICDPKFWRALAIIFLPKQTIYSLKNYFRNFKK